MIGFFGTFLYLLAYAYLTFYRAYKERVYVSINAVAAGILTYTSLLLESWQAVLVNGFWLVASLAILVFTRLPGQLPIPFRYYMGALLTCFVLALMVGVSSVTSLLVIVGWFSAINFCFAYYLFLSQRVTPRQYHVLNMLSAGFIIPALWLEQNWPVVVLEVCWVLISGHGVLQRREHTIP